MGGGGEGFSSTPRHELCSWAIQTCSCVSFYKCLTQTEQVELAFSPLHVEREGEGDTEGGKGKKRQRGTSAEAPGSTHDEKAETSESSAANTARAILSTQAVRLQNLKKKQKKRCTAQRSPSPSRFDPK